MKALNEEQIASVLKHGIGAFEANTNMTKHEAFGAIGTLKSVEDTIKRLEDAKLID